MKHTLAYILLLLTMLLTGCESYIEYNGPEEPEKLVLNCEYQLQTNNTLAPCVYITHSFFMGRNANDTVTIRQWYNSDNYDTHREDTVWYEYEAIMPSTGFVKDASVEVRLNEGEWQAMVFDPQNDYYCLSSWPETHPGDKIALRASHPTYGEVTTEQVVPSPLTATADYHNTDAHGLSHVTLHLPVYTGDETDVVGISCYGRLAYTSKFSGKVQGYDTIDLAATFSLDPVFAQLNNLQSDGGYYGADGHGMVYLPASALAEPRDIELYLDQVYNGTTNVEHTDWEVLAMEVEVSSVTRAYYNYKSSVLAATMSGRYLRDPYGKEVENAYDVQDYLDEVAEMLGAQEPVQIFSNITGGLGHFAAYVATRVTLK